MKWVDKLSESWLSAVTLCVLLVLTGFLVGGAWQGSSFLAILDQVGSFLSGVGTVAAVFVALTTYGNWKKQRYHDLNIERLYDLHDSLLEMRHFVEKIADIENDNVQTIFGMISFGKVEWAFREIKTKRAAGFFDEKFYLLEEKIYRLEAHKERTDIKNTFKSFKHYLSEVLEKTMYAEAEYLGDIDPETKEVLYHLNDEYYENLEKDSRFLSIFKSAVIVETSMCLNSLNALRSVIRVSIDHHIGAR